MLQYRKEIDGLRAIAVFAVIIFHAGYLAHGFLGVDMFFVISGYLITRIINNQLANNCFSLLRFYERRIRRIVPMLLVISIIALGVGYFTFLPDDFENLNESIIASSLFANNILLLLTRGYWDIANTYKPLVHTWSLGVEEQFYLLFPLLLILIYKLRFTKKKIQLSLIALIILSIASNFIAQKNTFHFYSVTSRFYQLAFGALLVYLKTPTNKTINKVATILGFIGILVLLLLPHNLPSFSASLLITVCTASLIYYYQQPLLTPILQNKPIVFVGNISYSLYMWHQLVFCFFRITINDDISITHAAILIVLIFLLAIISYYTIENPFRNKQFMATKPMLITIIAATTVIISIASIFYIKHGIVRDVPEIDIYLNKPNQVDAYWQYNERVYKMDTDFKNSGKQKLLVIGNSYARDFVNMLLENNYTDSFDISFKTKFFLPSTKQRVQQANLIIIGNPVDSNFLNQFCSINSIDKHKIIVVGTKSFGANNNLLFNTLSSSERCKAKVPIEERYININTKTKAEIGHNYVNLIGLLLNKNNQVPVFTPECKMISQDYKHLTKYGAKYLGSLLVNDSCFNHFIKHLSNYNIHKL